MLGPQQPLGEAQAIARQIGREGGQHRRRVGRDLVAALVVLAAIEHERHRPASGFSCITWADRAAGLHVGLLAVERFALLRQRSGSSSSRLVSHQSYKLVELRFGSRFSGGVATTADSAELGQRRRLRCRPAGGRRRRTS